MTKEHTHSVMKGIKQKVLSSNPRGGITSAAGSPMLDLRRPASADGNCAGAFVKKTAAWDWWEGVVCGRALCVSVCVCLPALVWLAGW